MPSDKPKMDADGDYDGDSPVSAAAKAAAYAGGRYHDACCDMTDESRYALDVRPRDPGPNPFANLKAVGQKRS